MGSRKNLTGARFGKLLVIEPTDKRMGSGSVVWRCRCDCGNLTEVSSRRLVGGEVRSCGCLTNPVRKDYVGERFGRLTVLDYAGTAQSLGKVGSANYWHCRCDCGKESIVSQSELQSGGTRSCGCLQKERAAEQLELLDGTSAVLLERNKKIRSNNKSGYTGVFQEKNGKWLAYINFKKKRYFLGRFPSLQEAVQARRQGEKMHDDFLDWYYGRSCKGKPEDSCPRNKNK